VAAVVLAAALVVSGSAASDEDCCSCGFQSVEPLSGADALPCAFDHPAGWRAMPGDDGAAVHAVVAPPPCGKACAGSPGIAFSVAHKANTNAETMEEVWTQVMKVAGTARCGGAPVTFFSLPGSDPNGLTGGLRFHVGQGGRKYGANVTFSCSAPGEWLRLQELFINTLRTNEGTTFVGR
jgi:hypothetical protein